MSVLGDLFELVVCGPERLPAFEARATYELGGRERRLAQVWSAGTRLREEQRDEAGELAWLGVNDGVDWWTWDVRRGVARTNTRGDRSSAFGIGGASPLIRGQGRLAVSSQTDVVGREEVAGRPALRVRIPGREIWVDSEYGSALRAIFEERVLFDVTEIVYGIDIDETRFQIDPLPPEVEVRAASQPYDEGPIAEIAALVPFPVFAPGKVTVDWQAFDASRHYADALKPETVHVQLGQRVVWISQSESPNPESFAATRTKPEDWRSINRNGLELEVCDSRTIVRLRREGVYLELGGEGSNLAQLIAIAESLRPVPRATDTQPAADGHA